MESKIAISTLHYIYVIREVGIFLRNRLCTSLIIKYSDYEVYQFSKLMLKELLNSIRLVIF